MDLSDVLTLVSYTAAKDTKGVNRYTPITNNVFCNVSSVSASEFFAAGAQGLKPELRFTMFRFDYSGQDTVIYDGDYYSVYRTYRGKNDMIELYCQKKVGVHGGES